MDNKSPHCQVFILFPESNPQFFYIQRNIEFQGEGLLNEYFRKLKIAIELIQIENYQGFYDSNNIKHFLEEYEILEEYYPSNPSRYLRTLLKDWGNWRDRRVSELTFNCQLLNQSICDETFCEIVTKKIMDSKNKYLLVSHDALHIPIKSHDIESEGIIHIVDCVSLTKLHSWFYNNRIPERIYHPSPKHGENSKGEWKGESKLYCSHNEAEDLLKMAFGRPELDELFYFDTKHEKYIIFRYEGKIGKDQYHAYHLEDDLKKSLKQLEQQLREIEQNG